MIRSSEISKLAHQLGLGDKTIEKDYVLTWVLLGLAASPLCELLAFKGGTAIKKIYIPDYRYSEDLDFTLLDTSLTNEALQADVEACFPWLRREANLTLATRKVEVHSSGNPALYLNYIGPLQGALASRFIKVDFSRDEILEFPPRREPLKTDYSDCQGRTARLVVYSLEEILVEKLRSLLTRTEPRDLYDVHYLLTSRLVDIEQVVFGIKPKFDAKGFVVSDLRTILTRRQPTFQQLWLPRLQGQMPDIPPLESVIRETNRILQRYF
ncbi:MAG: nucleotidyl transferase AbiEii/AbiGii toxin family protein [Anaerolineales bacterium]|nr:nucleotidyl transferase AbiEii/AbiGii toxin family protein [Anaerolineales bacterium]